MSHSFLIQPGQWQVSGHVIDQAGAATSILGTWHISWTQDDWFQMTAQLGLSSDLNQNPSLVWELNYKGYLSPEGQTYNYVSNHTKWGRVEGHGRLTPATITHQFWGVGDHRTGFETFYKLSDDCYTLTTGFMERHKLLSTLELVLKKNETR